MPNCFQCEKETPVTDFYLLRRYVNSYGYYWYFCSFNCLLKWLKRQEKCVARRELSSGLGKDINWQWKKENGK